MGEKLQGNPMDPVSGSKKGTALNPSAVILVLIVLTTLLIIPISVQARTPDWTYSSPDSLLGGVAVTSKGDLVTVGAEKILFFNRTGTLFAKEPYGSNVILTPDGIFSASAYFSTVYFYKNSLPNGTTNRVPAKVWEYEFPQSVR